MKNDLNEFIEKAENVLSKTNEFADLIDDWIIYTNKHDELIKNSKSKKLVELSAKFKKTAYRMDKLFGRR